MYYQSFVRIAKTFDKNFDTRFIKKKKKNRIEGVRLYHALPLPRILTVNAFLLEGKKKRREKRFSRLSVKIHLLGGKISER